ncbi:hypothetical protein ACQ4PT_063077 [Festuca glaucescens]
MVFQLGRRKEPVRAEGGLAPCLGSGNVSTNFFSGEIPNVGVLGTFKSSSFVGNLELCGLPVQKVCRGTLGFPAVLPHSDPLSSSGVSPISSNKTSHFLNGIVIGSMSTIAVALIAVMGFLWVCLLSRKKKSVDYVKMDKPTVPDGAKLVTYQWNLPYSSSEIIRRLELLDEEDVVGCGVFGTVYKMVMDDGTAFAVKRIDLNRERRDKTFEKELEILGSIRHINLVNLRGYCRLSTAKLLIYDFLELGSLDGYLHEYLQNGHSTEKSDVYSFGVLLLELVTGKRPTDSCFLNKGLNIVGWLNTLTGEHRLEEIVDERSGDVEVEAVEAILDIAAMCTDAVPGQRPSMSAVLKMLEEEILSPTLSEIYYEQHLEF